MKIRKGEVEEFFSNLQKVKNEKIQKTLYYYNGGRSSVVKLTRTENLETNEVSWDFSNGWFDQNFQNSLEKVYQNNLREEKLKRITK